MAETQTKLDRNGSPPKMTGRDMLPPDGRPKGGFNPRMYIWPLIVIVVAALIYWLK